MASQSPVTTTKIQSQWLAGKIRFLNLWKNYAITTFLLTDRQLWDWLPFTRKRCQRSELKIEFAKFNLPTIEWSPKWILIVVLKRSTEKRFLLWSPLLYRQLKSNSVQRSCRENFSKSENSSVVVKTSPHSLLLPLLRRVLGSEVSCLPLMRKNADCTQQLSNG